MWFFNFFCRKPKLKLNFIDTDYDAVMFLFKQTLYLDKIAEAITDKNSQPNYVLNLMDGFTQLYKSAGKKVIREHKKKVLMFGDVEPEKLEQQSRRVMGNRFKVMNFTLNDFSSETIHLLSDIFIFNKENNSNKIVYKTFTQVLGNLKRFSTKLQEGVKNREDEICGLYGEDIFDFLHSINSSIRLYHKIGKWLQDDAKEFLKYKTYLEKLMKQHGVQNN